MQGLHILGVTVLSEALAAMPLLPILYMVFHPVGFSSSDFLLELAHHQVVIAKKMMQKCGLKVKGRAQDAAVSRADG